MLELLEETLWESRRERGVEGKEQEGGDLMPFERTAETESSLVGRLISAQGASDLGFGDADALGEATVGGDTRRSPFGEVAVKTFTSSIVLKSNSEEELFIGGDLGVLFDREEFGFVERDARDGRIWIGDGFGVGLPSTGEGSVVLLAEGEVLSTRHRTTTEQERAETMIAVP